jgi:MOSC domain-containing protein YiiM
MLFKELFDQYAQPGVVRWIGVCPDRRKPLLALSEVLAVETRGLKGDRYAKVNGVRQVTLIQAEHLRAVSLILGREEIHPGLLRRNIVVSGINLISLKGRSFRIGEAIFEYSGECHPCSRMEENLGTGGYNAMRGHGGITAKIIEGGLIRIGDPVIPIIPAQC